MKKIVIALLSLLPIVALAQKTFKITSKSYNSEGLILDKSGKPFSGNGTESLKKEGILTGEVINGNAIGLWKHHKKKTLQGYNYYENKGNTTYAFNSQKELDWIEVIDVNNNSVTEIKVDKKGSIEKLYIIDYNKDNSHENTFEFEKLTGDYYDITIADYDYNSLSVIDYFKNNKGEQELVLRDFDKHHELIKINSQDHHIKDIMLLGDLLEKPEDAEYSLEKGFNASFTDLNDKDNFKLSLLTGKSPIFEIIVKNGKIIQLDKVVDNKSVMLVFSEKMGYAPIAHKLALKHIDKANSEIINHLK